MEHRNFFEGYRPTNLTADPLPLKVLNHSIWKAEMLGHALDWALQYLHQKSCPPDLVSPLLGKVMDEISKADLSSCYSNTSGGQLSDEVDAEMVEENVSYQPLKLMQSVTTAVDNICLRYKEENDRIETDFPKQPDTDATDGSPKIVFGASYHSIKNTRRTMEDRMVVLPDIDKVFHLRGPANYFAVFDGHNGVEAAAYSAAHLHRYLASSPDYPDDLSAALNHAFEATDTALLMKCKDESIRSGTTAVVALVVPGSIYVAWAGDSQAFLVRNGKTESLVSPHKPDREDEMRRIKSVGGEVISISGTWRVNGNLAVSRAIGNLDYKEYVTSTPEVSHVVTNGSEEFLILACDGLWDVVSPQRCVEILRETLLSDNPSDIDTVGHKLVLEAKRSGSGDNITVIVVFLKSKEDLIKAYKGEKMNGTTQAETPAAQIPVSPPKVAETVKSPVAASAKVPPASAAKSHTSPTKTTGSVSTRTSLSSRTSAASAKGPVSKPSIDRKPAPSRAPTATQKPTTAASGVKTTVQKDASGASTNAGTGARPAPKRPAGVGLTSRTQVPSKTATTAARKPLKPDETDKPGATKSTVPPRPRPGTAPLSSRVTATPKVAPKTETNKAGEDAKETTTTKRSALTKSAAPRVAPTRQPVSATAPKPRVPPTAASSTRPTSATQAQKSAAAPPPRKPTSTTASAASRPPLKKPTPSAPAAKKDASKTNGQPVPVPKKIVGKKQVPESATLAKVNGISTKPVEPESVKEVNGDTKHSPLLNGHPVEAEIESTKVEGSETVPPVEKLVEIADLLGSDIAEGATKTTSAVENVEASSTLSANNVENVTPKESQVLNGDLVGYVENLDVGKPGEAAENKIEQAAEIAPTFAEPVAEAASVEDTPVAVEEIELQKEEPVVSTSPDLSASGTSIKPSALPEEEVTKPATYPEETEQKCEEQILELDKPSEDILNFNSQPHPEDTVEQSCEEQIHELDKPVEDIINFNAQTHPEEKSDDKLEEKTSELERPAEDISTFEYQQFSKQPEPEPEINFDIEHAQVSAADEFAAMSAPAVADTLLNELEPPASKDTVVEQEDHVEQRDAEIKFSSENIQSSLSEVNTEIQGSQSPDLFAAREGPAEDKIVSLDAVEVEAASPEPPREDTAAHFASPESRAGTDDLSVLSPEPSKDVDSRSMEELDFNSTQGPEVAYTEEIPAAQCPESDAHEEGIPQAITPEPTQLQQDFAKVGEEPSDQLHHPLDNQDCGSDFSGEAPPHEADVVLSPEPLPEQNDGIISPSLDVSSSQLAAQPLSPQPQIEKGDSEVLEGDGTNVLESRVVHNIVEPILEPSHPSAESRDLFADIGMSSAKDPEALSETVVVEGTPVDDPSNLSDLRGAGENMAAAIQDPVDLQLLADMEIPVDENPESPVPQLTDDPVQDPSTTEERALLIDPDRTEEQPAKGEEVPSSEPADFFSTNVSEAHGNPFGIQSNNPFSSNDDALDVSSQFSSGAKAVIPDFSTSEFSNTEINLKPSGFEDINRTAENVQSFDQQVMHDDSAWSNNNKFEDQGHKIFDPLGTDFSTFEAQQVAFDPFGTDVQINGSQKSGEHAFGALELGHQTDYHQEALLDYQGSVATTEKVHTTADPESQIDSVGN